MSKAITKKGVLAAHKQYAKLINAVLKGFNCSTFAEVQQTMNDVRNNGIDGGFGSYCYYTDTYAFAMKYRSLIVKLLQEQADEQGIEIVAMVSGFRQFRKIIVPSDCLIDGENYTSEIINGKVIFSKGGIDKETLRDLYKYIGGGKLTIENEITNIVCWFAVEEVCRWFIND